MACRAATFAYKAVDGAGLPQEGMITGVSESAVMEELKQPRASRSCGSTRRRAA